MTEESSHYTNRYGWHWNDNFLSIPASLPDGSPWPSISIVTPSFNQGQFLEETIRSVLLPGYPNLEYLVVDDCSTDDSVEIIKKYERRLIFSQNDSNSGQAETLNQGFMRSSGEIMGTINGDDVFLPYTLFLVARIFHQFPEIDWITGHSSSLVDGQVISPRRNHIDAYNSKLMRLGFNTSWLLGVPQHISTFFRRNLYDKAGAYIDKKNYHSLDIDLWIRMSKYSAPVFLPATLASLRVHNQQQSVHSNIGFMELESKKYNFLPLYIRKIIVWGMKSFFFRGIIRRTIFDGKAQRLNWNSQKNTWEIKNCSVF